MKVIKSKRFANGIVYALGLDDGKLIETTDTFLPPYTKHCINENTNQLRDGEAGSRNDRWMIGVSVMSGCPVGCKFCATGQLKGWRNLKAEEIVEQVRFIVDSNPNYDPSKSFEFKINYTRMGEPMLNTGEVVKAIKEVDTLFPNAHHYVSTIGIQGMDTSWIKDNITLQLSLHSLDETRRDQLIPFTKKMSIKALGQVRTQSNLQTTLNMTLIDEDDFDIEVLKRHFDPQYFFVKLSPVNTNETSVINGIITGIISERNLI
jgi:23S rRNA (adenine2503-C2)-methyltransferase